jgi:hypothetical protein
MVSATPTRSRATTGTGHEAGTPKWGRSSSPSQVVVRLVRPSVLEPRRRSEQADHQRPGRPDHHHRAGRPPAGRVDRRTPSGRLLPTEERRDVLPTPVRLLDPTCPLPAGRWWAAGVGERRLIGFRSRRLAPSPSWARIPAPGPVGPPRPGDQRLPSLPAGSVDRWANRSWSPAAAARSGGTWSPGCWPVATRSGCSAAGPAPTTPRPPSHG